MVIRPSYWMGLPHQTVWGLFGTSYQGDPLNVGRSNTINIFGTIRRAASCTWLNILSHSLISHLVKVVTCTPSHIHMTLQLVTFHLLGLNMKFHIINFILSVPSLASSWKQSDWSKYATSSICIKGAKSHSYSGCCIINGRRSSCHTSRSHRSYWRKRGTSGLLKMGMR